MAKKLTYSEGDYFSIPLRTEGFARGVVARMNGNGVAYGYFFPPPLEGHKIDSNLSIGNEVLIGQFGDLGLINGDWKVLGKIPKWSRSQWRMLPLLRWDECEEKGILCRYDEDTLKCINEEVIIIDSDLSNLPRDGLMGCGFVEIKLTKMLIASM